MKPCIMKWESEAVNITATITSGMNVKMEIDFDLKNQNTFFISRIMQMIEQECAKELDDKNLKEKSEDEDKLYQAMHDEFIRNYEKGLYDSMIEDKNLSSKEKSEAEKLEDALYNAWTLLKK